MVLQTIKNMIKAGIKGVIVENKKTFIENPNITFKIIKKIIYYFMHYNFNEKSLYNCW